MQLPDYIDVLFKWDLILFKVGALLRYNIRENICYDSSIFLKLVFFLNSKFPNFLISYFYIRFGQFPATWWQLMMPAKMNMLCFWKPVWIGRVGNLFCRGDKGPPKKGWNTVRIRSACCGADEVEPKWWNTVINIRCHIFLHHWFLGGAIWSFAIP